MKGITSLLLIAAVALCTSTTLAASAPQPAKSPVETKLSAAPAPELPATAADLVKSAKAKQRQATTREVVTTAVGINPAAAPAIVGAISRSVPEMAPIAAANAALKQPAQAAAIARAAAAAAPSKAGKIVAAVCAVTPKDYRNIAVAVATVVPTSGKEILESVGEAIPELKSRIAQSLASYGGNANSVALVLDTAAATPSTVAANGTPGNSTSTDPLPRAPGFGAPYIPLSGTPSTSSPVTSTNVPPGGRDYTAP